MPGYFERERCPMVDSDLPDCTQCRRFGGVLELIENGQFLPGIHDSTILRRMLLNAVDVQAMSNIFYRNGACPFGQLVDQEIVVVSSRSAETIHLPAKPLREVLQEVPHGSCAMFDAVYRPGVDSDQILQDSQETPPQEA